MEMDDLESITHAHKAKKRHIKLKNGTLGGELYNHQKASLWFSELGYPSFVIFC